MSGPDDDETRDESDSFLRAVAAAPAVPLGSLDHDEGLDLPPGERIAGRYEVRRSLGRGGMGEVVLAHDTELDRPVAIKIHLAAPRPGGLDRLQREARALASLRHPNVVEVFDVGTVRGRLYVAMEYVPGGDLRRWLSARPRRWPEVRDRFVQAGRGLAAAHAAGLVHRDFKPDNVLVGDDGRVRVADFGLVRESVEPTTLSAPPASDHASIAEATRTGVAMGTPAYMAPEQWQGERVDARADQFAFCVALFEAVTGTRPPTPRSTEPPAAVAPPMGDPVVPGVPASLEAVVQRGMSPRPDDRFSDMPALLEQLVTEPPRRGRGWMAAGALALAAAAGVIAWWPDDPRARCADGRDDLAEVWSPARAQRVSASLADAGADPTAVATVADGLGQHAVAWLEHRARACALARDPEPAAAFDRRMDCLRRDLIGFDAALDLLAHADADLVGRAPQLVPSAAGLERCEDDEALAAAHPPPEDPATATEVAALRDELARWPALDAAGRYADAERRYAAVVTRARATAHPPVLAPALFIHGEAVLNLGRAAEAEPLLTEAYHVARSVEDDMIAYQAAATLVRVVGFDLDRPDEALRWGKHAEVVLPRIPEGQRVRGMLFDAMSTIHRNLGDLEAAEAAQRRAVEEARRSEEGGWEHGGTMLGLAGILTHRGRFDQARLVAERALEILEGLRPEHPAIAIAHSKLAPILQAQGDLEQAIEHLRLAVEILERAYPQGHPQVAAAINNYGDTLVEAGRVDEGLRAIERSVDMFAELDPGSRRHMFVTKGLANALAEAGRVDEAIERYQQVLALQDDPVLRAQTLNDLGDTLRSQGRPDAAIERFEQAIAGLEQAYGDAHPELALPRANLGYSRLAQGRFTDAAAQFEAAARALADHDPDDPERLYALTGEGIARLGQGRRADALARLERASTLARSPAADPDEAALAHLALARALRERDGSEAEARVRILEADAAAAPGYDALRAELSAWLGEARALPSRSPPSQTSD